MSLQALATRHAGALQFTLYLLIAVVFTWPLLPQLATAVPSDPGDPLLNTWILWWNARQVPFTRAAWNAPAFYPAHGVLAFSETLLGISLATNPIQWLGAGPQFAYNLAFLFSFVLSAIFTALLAYELTGRRDAAFIAGLAFGFHPFRVAHFPQLQVLSGYFMPLGLYGLHRYLRDKKPRWLVCFALSWVLTGLINGYYMLFFSVLVGMWFVWFAPGQKPIRVAALGLAWVAGMLLMLPVLLKYKSVHDGYGFTRHVSEIKGFSADVTAFLCTAGRLKFWGFLQLCKRPENELFTGVTLPLLVLAGLAIPQLRAANEPSVESSRWARLRRWCSPRSFYLLSALAMWIFSLGPEPSWLGTPGPLPGPYALLMRLPGFHSLRVPARFATLMMLCLAVSGGFAFAKLAPRLGRARWSVCVLLCCGIMADVWLTAMPLAARPERIALERAGGHVPLLELPMGQNDLPAQYRSIYHGRPVVNGYSGYTPPYYDALQNAFRGRELAGLSALASFGPIDILLHKQQDPDGKLAEFLDTAPMLQQAGSDAAYALYNLPASPSASRSSRTAPKLRIASMQASKAQEDLPNLTDGDLTTRWSAGEQRGKQQFLQIDLGSVQSVGSVVLAIGPYENDYPRDLSVETAESEDGEWSEAWHGDTRGELLAATMRDRKRLPITLAWSERSARFIRLKNRGRAPHRWWWSIGELEVHAPH